MILIENAGQRIVTTDFWTSEYAKKGYVFLSWNAGAARLLLPDSQKSLLKDMKSAKEVIVSRGPWPEQGREDALELLFEDRSDRPFALHLGMEMTDRTLPDTEQGGGFIVAVWTRGGQKLRLPGKYRRVGRLPCLAEWVVN